MSDNPGRNESPASLAMPTWCASLIRGALCCAQPSFDRGLHTGESQSLDPTPAGTSHLEPDQVRAICAEYGY